MSHLMLECMPIACVNALMLLCSCLHTLCKLDLMTESPVWTSGSCGRHVAMIVIEGQSKNVD